LANQIGVNINPVCEVVRNGAVDFFEPEKFEVLADRLRRFAAAECMDDGVQRDPRAGNIVVAVPPFNVVVRA
jgi:hypothetical protein